MHDNARSNSPFQSPSPKRRILSENVHRPTFLEFETRAWFHYMWGGRSKYSCNSLSEAFACLMLCHMEAYFLECGKREQQNVVKVIEFYPKHNRARQRICWIGLMLGNSFVGCLLAAICAVSAREVIVSTHELKSHVTPREIRSSFLLFDKCFGTFHSLVLLKWFNIKVNELT